MYGGSGTCPCTLQRLQEIQMVQQPQPEEHPLAAEHLHIEHILETHARPRRRRLARTHHRQRRVGRLDPFHQHLDPPSRRLEVPAAAPGSPVCRSAPADRRAEHPADHHEPWNPPVRAHVQHQQLGTRPLRQRLLGDQFRGKRIVEVGDAHGARCYHAALPAPSLKSGGQPPHSILVGAAAPRILGCLERLLRVACLPLLLRYTIGPRRGGGTGRRAGLKIRFWQQSASSILAPGTIRPPESQRGHGERRGTPKRRRSSVGRASDL
jgi:hypothetical protein